MSRHKPSKNVPNLIYGVSWWQKLQLFPHEEFNDLKVAKNLCIMSTHELKLPGRLLSHIRCRQKCDCSSTMCSVAYIKVVIAQTHHSVEHSAYFYCDQQVTKSTFFKGATQRASNCFCNVSGVKLTIDPQE